MNTIVEKGFEIIKEATEAYNANRLEEAQNQYKQGVSHQQTGSKYIKSDKQKQAILSRISGYIDRAEEIDKYQKKNTIQTEGNSTTVSAVTTRKAQEYDNKQQNDPETLKLQNLQEGVIIKEKPNVKWDDVAGLEQAKNLLKETVILPVKFPQLFVGGTKPWKGILLYGPPGTGKSYLAKAVATESGSSCFLSVSSSDLVSKYQGESEKLVKGLFELARKNIPSIIFIDEIDSLCSARGEGENESSRRIKTEFLVQMQGVGKGSDGILVLGATNVPWELDSAIRRRFEKRVYIPLPDPIARSSIFKIHINKTPNTLDEEDFLTLGQVTNGFSGSDISVCVREALYTPIRICQNATHFVRIYNDGKYMYTPCSPSEPNAQEMSLYDIAGEDLLPPKLCLQHFLDAVNNTKSTVSPADLVRQEEWTQQFGTEG